MKRLVTIQDISCFGKCSSTVALPIISALGIETVILPTAILSTHTGEFENYTFLSLTDEMGKISTHWKDENIEFDAIYVGYIGSIQQIDIICEFIDNFRGENTIVYVDPAMADNAKLYSGISHEYVQATKKLLKKADIISPNIYEAMLLVDEECKSEYTHDEAKQILYSLGELCDKSIITGVHLGDKILTLGYDKTNDEFFEVENEKIEGMFYGTGDIFASVFIGTYLRGLPFPDAISSSDAFIQKCIIKTLDEKEKYWYGINFEMCLDELFKILKSKDN